MLNEMSPIVGLKLNVHHGAGWMTLHGDLDPLIREHLQAVREYAAEPHLGDRVRDQPKSRDVDRHTVVARTGA